MPKWPSIEDIKRMVKKTQAEAAEIFLLFQESKYLLGEAKRYASKDAFRCSLYSRAAIIHAVFALEAYLRTMLEPRLAAPFIPLVYDSFRRLKDRAQYFHYCVSGFFLETQDHQWRAVCRAISLRNRLAHPRPDKPARKLSPKQAEDAVMACLGFLALITSRGGQKPSDWMTNPESEFVHALDAVRRRMRIRAIAG
jgi:hypothetical protein